MQPNYDFSDAVKNPFAQRLKKEGHTVVIHHPPPSPRPSGRQNAAPTSRADMESAPTHGKPRS
jgi:hypothetical protein